jgi:GNAT superfamily N-acetyltransferase
MIDSSEVYAAHADAWQTQGRLRQPFGGGAATFGGWRLMASGLPFGYLNAACVTDPRHADVAEARAWYRGRDVPWGALLPAGTPWPHGRLLLTQHIMAVEAGAFSGRAMPDGLELRKGDEDDLGASVMVDAGAFGTDSEASRAWMKPHFGFDEVDVAIGELDGAPVATGYALRCDGEAGPTVYLGGIAVLPAVRRRGVAAALSSWLLGRGFDRGARFAHLQCDSEAAGRVYSSLGFTEVGDIDIYVDL